METGSGYFLSFSALTHQIPTVEGKRIRCVRQKRSIRRNIELPVAIHEVHVASLSNNNGGGYKNVT